jgi:Family of unknown function (DUF6022)
MPENRTLASFLKEGSDGDIFAITRFVEAHVNDNWQVILDKHHTKLLAAYEKAGEMAYGSFLELLFKEPHKQLRAAGLRAWPRLPGKFDISREWGNADETDQQRWMWSTVRPLVKGNALGTLVTITYHDHSRFHAPRAPGVFALRETGKEAVVESLSQRSQEFRQAREASIEIAEYLASLETKA